MDLFNLRAKLTLDVEDYNKNINEAKEKGNDLKKSTEKNSAKSVVAWAAVATAVVAVINKVKDLILASADYADQIGDMAEKWGFATKEIQEFDYWATMNGTTLESLLTGMRGLVNQAEAGAGAFDKLGVSVKNADGSLKGQKQLFLETIDALQKIDNQTERNALQFEIFGRAGIELGQIINLNKEQLNALSNEAESLGIILSEDTIKQASDFNDTLDQMKMSFKSIFAELVAGSPEANEKFMAFLEGILVQAENWLPRLLQFIVQLMPKVLNLVGKFIPRLPAMILDALTQVNWIEFFTDLFFALTEAIVGVVKNTLGILIGYGWIWGEDKRASSSTAFKDTMTSLSNNYTNASNSNSNYSTDNSTYNVNVNMTSSGYTSEDARNLANEVIKEIATRKQASGR